MKNLIKNRGVIALKYKIATLLFFSLLSSKVVGHDDHNHGFNNSKKLNYVVSTKWQHLADGSETVGKSHGEMAVAKNGNLYVSIMGSGDISGGIRIYSPSGAYLGDVPNSPDDFHGFVIHQDASGEEFIYGTSLKYKRIVKMTLSGQVIFSLDAVSAIPAKYQRIEANKPKLPSIKLTAIDVDKKGNLYVVDGYSLDYIHKFSSNGEYISSFGGQNAPYHFKNCHKIHIDPRFSPNRLMCTDRANGRLVHMALDGALIGTYVENLRRPSSVAFFGELAAIAEISGRVSIVTKNGQTIKTLGTNDVQSEINTNITTPDQWKVGVFTAPHGITFDRQGNLFITEWNKTGRILRFDLPPSPNK